LTDGLNSRLGYIFNDPEYTVASALIPQAEFVGGCKCKTGNPQKQLLQFIEQVQSEKNSKKASIPGSYGETSNAMAFGHNKSEPVQAYRYKP